MSGAKLWRALGQAALAALLAVPSCPAAQPTTPPAAEGRVLLIVDTSLGMRRRAAGTLNAVDRLLRSDLGGCLRAGDTLGLWTFDSEVHMGRFPLQVWSPSRRDEIAAAVVEFLRQQRHRGWANLDAVLAEAAILVRESPAITLVVLTDGSSPARGTPFDATIAADFAEFRAEQRRVRLPLVLVLQAAGGRYRNYLVVQPQWPLILRPSAAGQQREAGVAVTPTPAAAPAPTADAKGVAVTAAKAQPAPAVAEGGQPANRPATKVAELYQSNSPPQSPAPAAESAPLQTLKSAANLTTAPPANPPTAPTSPTGPAEARAAGPAPRPPDAPLDVPTSKPDPATAQPPQAQAVARSPDAQKQGQAAASPAAAASATQPTKPPAASPTSPGADCAPPQVESGGLAAASLPTAASTPQPAAQATVPTAAQVRSDATVVKPEVRPSPAPPAPATQPSDTRKAGAETVAQPAPRAEVSRDSGAPALHEPPPSAAGAAGTKAASAGLPQTTSDRLQQERSARLSPGLHVEPEQPAGKLAATNVSPIQTAVVSPPHRVGGWLLLAAGFLLLGAAVALLLLIWRRAQPASPHASLITQSLARDRSSPARQQPGDGDRAGAGGA